MYEPNANSVNPDQTPRSAASDLGLYCLPMSILWDARLERVKGFLFKVYNTQNVAKQHGLILCIEVCG